MFAFWLHKTGNDAEPIYSAYVYLTDKRLSSGIYQPAGNTLSEALL